MMHQSRSSREETNLSWPLKSMTFSTTDLAFPMREKEEPFLDCLRYRESDKIQEERNSFRSTHGLQDQDGFSTSGRDSPSILQSHRGTLQIERISAKLDSEQVNSKPLTMADKFKNMVIGRFEQAKAVFGQPGANPAQSQFIVPQNRGYSTPKASTESRKVVDKLNDISARLGLDANDGVVILLATAVFTVMLLLVLWTMIRRY